MHVELAHLADPAIGVALTERGYRLESYERVLGRALAPAPEAAERDMAAAGVERYVALNHGVFAGGAALRRADGVAQLAGAATAAAGPIVLVGLAIPHLARAIVGPDHRWILAYSTVLGPVALLVCDTLGRVIARPAEVQVGIVTAVLGAPLFVALVRRRRLLEL